MSLITTRRAASMNLNHGDRSAEQKSFLLSSIPSKTDRDRLAQKISDLGGFHIDSKHFDESASHIICGKLLRTEKFLGACVTGKWILPPQYIEDSHQVQMWLDEEDYEFSVTDTNQPEVLVSAAKRWKWKNNMYGSLPFTDWHVSLYMNSKKRAGFQKILLSGGARIVPLEDRHEIQNVAFVLVDAEKLNAVSKLQEDSDILCIREDYLADFIVKDPEPDIFDYVIDKEGNKKNIVTIIQSPLAEPKNASKSKPEAKTEDSRNTDEKLVISNDETASGDKKFESIVLTSTQKVNKEKRPLAVRSSEAVFPKQLANNMSSGSDEIIPPIKKAKKTHNYNHRMPQFSPKNLRSLPQTKHSSNNKCPGLRVYEDNSFEGNDLQMSSDKEKSTLISLKNPKLGKVSGKPTKQNVLGSNPDPNISSCSIPPPVRTDCSKTTAMEMKVSGDVLIEQTSECSPTGSQTVLKHPTSTLSSVLLEDTQTPPRPSGNTSKSQTTPSDGTSLSIASKVMENRSSKSTAKSVIKSSVAKPSTKVQEGYESKVRPDEITNLFKKKPVQMSLQQFGFQNSKTLSNGLKIMESSPKLKSETTSAFKISSSVVSQFATPEKVKPTKDLSNTPDTAIVIDESCEFDDLTELCHSIECDQASPERASDKHLASTESATKESLDDLMEDLISLCNDVDDDKQAPTKSQQNKAVVSESLIHHEVGCNDSTVLTLHSNSVLETESVVDNVKNLAVKDVEVENNLASCENKELSVKQPKEKFQQLCNVSNKEHHPALKVLERDGKKGIQTESSHAESKILLKCDKPRRSLYLSTPSSITALSYFLDSGADTLFSMNDPCINSAKKAFTSPLIPQWMRVSSEMKFYVVSLEHGRPDVNQKPTKELLSELINMLTCEDTRIRNLAFHYLMSWFEENPPTDPISSKVYCDLFGFITNKTLMTDLLDTIISSPRSEGHLLHLDFVVAVCEVNFWHHVNSGDRNSIKECLLIKWLWDNCSQKIHFNTNITHVLETFGFILALNSKNKQSVNSMATLLGLIFECLRLVGNYWSIKNFSCLTDCMISFSLNLAKKIMETFENGDEQAVILMLQLLKNPWLRTLVTASILSNLNDFLVLETIQVNSICLKSIVTQYFFLLPPLTKRPGSSIGQGPRVVLERLSISQDKGKRGACDVKSYRSVKVNKRNGKGESKVHEAAIKNDAEKLKLLLSIPGVDVNMKDNCGWTPLHEACNHGSYECAVLLLNFVPNINSVFDNKDDMQRRVDISAKGFVSKTPLHDAVVNNHIDICRLLLKYGGKKLLEAKTDDGYTPLDLAKTHEMREVLLMHENQGSHSVFPLINIDNHLPLSCMYDKVLKSGQDCLYATKKDCSWFLSFLSLLISSYMDYALLKGGNSLNDRDLVIANSMDLHISLLREHLKNITSSETYESLQFQIHMLKTIACEG